MKKELPRTRKRKKIRAKISGTETRPRLSVFKSNKMIYAQVIDDNNAVTLAAAKGADAKKVGEAIAKATIAKKINTVTFDRGGYVYTGKIMVLADSARSAGLKF